MRFYENEAKRIFSAEGITVPTQYGLICKTSDLDKIKDKISYPLMIKSVVLIGGRGKAGGIKKADNFDDAKSKASAMIGMDIKGYKVEMLMLEKAVEQIGACYVGVTMNPANFNVIMMVSPSGGVDIETVAKENPEKILKIELPGNEKTLPDNVANQFTDFILNGIDGISNQRASVKDIISRVYATFQKYDCKVAEINPMIITPDGPVAADAKIVMDDNAIYRQGEILETLGIREKRHDVSEPTRNEVRARNAGFTYVDLLPEDHVKDPNILYVGLVPGGAGYGIFSIDETANVGDRFFGGRVIPVNFMDSGGGPKVDAVMEMFDLLMDYELVDLVITSRFGGISSCDIFIRGLVESIRRRRRTSKRVVPVYGRMVGTDLPSARDFLEKAYRETPDELKDMKIYVGNRIIMAEVIKEGIQKAFEMKGWA
jgi:succinyl-CoA synthetase beta subunit